MDKHHHCLSLGDEQKLLWFFSEGQIAFERSSAGPMLERAELYGHIGQLRYVSRADDFEVVAERLRPRAPTWPTVQDGAIVRGYEITARPTAETRAAQGYTPDAGAMQRYAAVSHVLRTLERYDRRLVEVLEALYGELGAQWARGGKPGRIGALYHLTSSGLRLLDASAALAKARGQPVIGSPARRMVNECAAKRTDARRLALMAADGQAAKLRLEAIAGWNECRMDGG